MAQVLAPSEVINDGKDCDQHGIRVGFILDGRRKFVETHTLILKEMLCVY